MFDFLKYPKHKIESLSNGKSIAYVKKNFYTQWKGIDANQPGQFVWETPNRIKDYCICDDLEMAENVILQAKEYVAKPKATSIEDQIRSHLK